MGLAFYLDAATGVCLAIGLPVWRAAFDLEPWHLGLLGGGFTLALAVGALAGGLLGDRFGRARVFTFDLVVFLAGSLVLLSAAGAVSLLAGAVLLGMAA